MQPIKDLIKLKEKPQLVHIISQAIKNPRKTVADYVFTPSIKEHFETIFNYIYQKKGGGFWIQAEYGAGKTHFLATLTSLLIAENKEILNYLNDEYIKVSAKKILPTKLFPVVLNLRGESAINEEDNLLEVIVNSIENKIEELQLEDKVLITNEDEIIDWYKKSDFKDKIDVFLQKNVDKKETNINKNELAKLINKYCKENQAKPVISSSTKDKIKFIYSQLIKLGYEGMIIVIDEFYFWRGRHPDESPECKTDLEVLETIGWILPQELDLKIYTLIADQEASYTKLIDRFKKLELLAGKDKNDYDIIAAQRIREIIDEKKPEIDEYFEYYHNEFKFVKTIGKEFFSQIFPFQPKCFDVLRKITQKEAPTERSAINIAFETLNNEKILSRNTLINLSDLLISNHLIQDCLNNLTYRSFSESYKSAIEYIEDFDFDTAEKLLAERVIATLFLDYCAHQESTKYLKIDEITELTLTESGSVKNTDEVELVFNKLRDVPQIEYIKGKGAIFRPGKTGVDPRKIFNSIKKKIPKEFDNEKQKIWEELLVSFNNESGTESSLLAGYNYENNLKKIIESNKIEYPGELIIARDIRGSHYDELSSELHFKIIFLTKNLQIDVDSINDPRIVFCIPDEFSDAVIEDIRNYMATIKMEQEYINKSESDFESIKEWIKNNKNEFTKKLVSRQIEIYKNGKIITKQQINFDIKKIWFSGQIDRIIQNLVDNVLLDVYTENLISVNRFSTNKKITANDAKKVFDGLFKKNPAPASLSACDNFAAGLNLASFENKRKFNPDNNPVFEILEKLLVEGNDELAKWKIYNLLQKPPYGLIKEIITLYLLCFVHHKTMFEGEEKEVEIILKANNRQPSTINKKINAYNLQEVEWKLSLEDDFDVLVVSNEISWNEIINFARILNENLKITNKTEDITEQEKLLLQSCNSLSKEALQIRENLNSLSISFKEEINLSTKDCLDFFESLEQITNKNNFYEIVKEKFSNTEELKNSYQYFKGVKKVSDSTVKITEILKFLKEIQQNTEEAKELLQNINFNNIILVPDSIKTIENEFEKIKSQYQRKYQIYHRDFNKMLKELYEDLEKLNPKIKTLGNLEEIKQLHIDTTKLNLYEKYLKEVKNCTAKDPVAINQTPYCDNCNLKINNNFIDNEIKQFINQIDGKLNITLDSLRNILTDDVLLYDKENKLKNFISVLQQKNTEKLIALVTPELIKYILFLLSKANILVVKVSAFNYLKQNFNYIDEENIETAIKDLFMYLKKEMQEEKKKNPGKKVRLSWE